MQGSAGVFAMGSSMIVFSPSMDYGSSIAVEALASDIVATYPRIFEDVNLALRQYPDEDLAKTYIARKAMTDLQWKLDK